MKIQIVLMFFLLFSSIIMAQNNSIVNVQIKGQVIDSLSNETVPYATLKIVDKNNPTEVIKAVASDENGKFQIGMNKQGEFLLLAEYVGKTKLTVPLKIGQEKSIDIGKLMMNDNTLLSEVVISAQKPLVKVDLDKIIYSMEDDPEAKTNDVLEMLKKVPMVTVDGEENIRLKGSSNFKIYMNGKPSNMISSNPKDVLKSMPANTIKNIEVITDPGAKYDAEGVAGIINIITQKNTAMGGYTASLSAHLDSRGSIGGGIYTTMKYGKIGFTGNFNYYDYETPNNRSAFYSRNDGATDFRHIYNDGMSKGAGKGIYGSGEFSYEIDTLNLINSSFSRYGGNWKSGSELHAYALDKDNVEKYRYKDAGARTSTYGSTEFNIDYQRTFAGAKDRLLTTSYKLSISPNDSENNNDKEFISGMLPENIILGKLRQYSDADTKEHTFQSDFTTPFAKIHSLEVGLKYIVRINQSKSDYLSLTSSGEWIPSQDPTIDVINNKFKHYSDIIAAYAGYNLKKDKWGLKTGLRLESTNQRVTYELDENRNFKADYLNLVPSATVTYMLTPAQNLRFGYNLRISRPGIWQLNPYRNTSNPNFVNYGNPDLRPVKAHTINANYGFFNPKLNMNINLMYEFFNDGITDVLSTNDDVIETTYKNVAKSKKIGMSAYLNWSPNQKLNLYSNLSSGYVTLRANDGTQIKNDGFAGMAYGGVQYTMPWKMQFRVNGGIFLSEVKLQGKEPNYYFHSLSLRKSFLSDKLSIGAHVSNPFKKEYKNKTTNEGVNFYNERIMYNNNRRFGIYASFRFGDMKAQIKKAQRGINNDDVMQGQGGGAQGQGSQGGGGK